jgi:LysM repeat protein
MKHLLSILAALLFIINISIAQTVKQEIRIIGGKKYIIYQIKAGETWASIAEKSGITERSLIDANKQANGSLKSVISLKVPIEKSTKIILNENALSSEKVNSLETVTVDSIEKKILGKELVKEKKGTITLAVYKIGTDDNIDDLAKQYNCKVEEIISQNNLISSTLIPGKIIRIPVKKLAVESIANKKSGLISSSKNETQKAVIDTASKTKNNIYKPEIDTNKILGKENNQLTAVSIQNQTGNKPKIFGTALRTEIKGNKTLTVYKTGNGDNINTLAKYFNSSANDIQTQNNLVNSKLIPGKILKIWSGNIDTLKEETIEKNIQAVKSIDSNKITIKTKKNETISGKKNTINVNPIAKNEAKEIKTIKAKINKSEGTKNNFSNLSTDKISELEENVLKNTQEFSKEINSNELHSNTNVGDTKASYTHSVLAGETIEMIAKKYKISVSDIANWNNLNQNKIRVGQELIVNFKRANLPYLLANSMSPELTKQLKNTDKTASVKFVEEKGLCFLTEEKFIGIAHRNAPVGTLLLLTSTENYKKKYVRVTSNLINSNVDVIIQVDKKTAKELSFNSSLTNVLLSYSTIE